MADKYRDFHDLSGTECLGVDFGIRLNNLSVPVAIIAPHGGKIEWGTSEIAAAIAGNVYNLYCFEGMKSKDNRDLHITSTRFDEPKCVNLISACDLVVAVHGCQGDDQTIYLGGRDKDLREAIRENLQNAGFTTETHADPNLQGVNPDNICNRGRRGRGVQLEISKGLRTALLQASLTEGAGTLSHLANAVRCAIDELAGS